MTNPENAILLTIRETAALLSISESLAWKLVWSNQIPHIRLGRVVRIPRKALDDWISKGPAA